MKEKTASGHLGYKVDSKAVETRVAELEAKSAVEFVVCIARASMPHSFTFLISALIFLLSMLAGFLLLNGYLLSVISKPAMFGGFFEVEFIEIFLALVLSMALAVLSVRVDLVGRFIIPKWVQRFFCELKAKLEFFNQGVGQTQAHTGVLIFLSLVERTVIVRIDQSVHLKESADNSAGAQLENKCIIKMIPFLKQKDLTGALLAAIDTVAENIETVTGQVSKNELPNTIRFSTESI